MGVTSSLPFIFAFSKGVFFIFCQTLITTTANFGEDFVNTRLLFRRQSVAFEGGVVRVPPLATLMDGHAGLTRRQFAPAVFYAVGKAA